MAPTGAVRYSLGEQQIRRRALSIVDDFIDENLQIYYIKCGAGARNTVDNLSAAAGLWPAFAASAITITVTSSKTTTRISVLRTIRRCWRNRLVCPRRGR